jgi:hypothetical protein
VLINAHKKVKLQSQALSLQDNLCEILLKKNLFIFYFFMCKIFRHLYKLLKILNNKIIMLINKINYFCVNSINIEKLIVEPQYYLKKLKFIYFFLNECKRLNI